MKIGKSVDVIIPECPRNFDFLAGAKDVKKEGVKIFFIIFWTLFSIIVAFVEFMVLCWIIKTTVIKEIDGIKYCGVEYETNRLRKNIYYYKE